MDDAGWGWGTTFLDADNDGDLDLAVTNGFFSNQWPADESRFFQNDGGSPVTFSDVSAAVGFNDTFWGSSLIALDFDRDGDLDLIQACADGGPLRLLENQRSGQALLNSYLVVQPRLSGANHWAIGSTVRVRVGSTWMSRALLAGSSLLGQEPAEAFFGLGTTSMVDEVVVEWPDGTTTTITDVAANQIIEVVAPGTVPAASAWGCIVAGLALLASGTVMFRRHGSGASVSVATR